MHDGEVIAIVVRAGFTPEGIQFVSQNDYALQLGAMKRPAGYEVVPHAHLPIRRESIGTQEVLFVKSGKIRVDFYNPERRFLESRELGSGDVILMVSGGHGIEVVEEAVIFEVKNGPFVEGADKQRFEAVR